MLRMVKRGLLLGLAALFLCCTLGCKSSEKTRQEEPKGWGEDTRSNIMTEGVEGK